MPDKPFTVITYAASASLAAIALVYFFNPNQFLDGDSSTSTASTRKKGIVGLSNPANDCFINSILQSLAGLGELRLYLIRELHRRKLDGPGVYAAVPQEYADGRKIDVRNLASLQSGEVTRGLKYIIDKLNERPIYKKTISASDFIHVLEQAFGTKISKSQQDAQELLQVVAERLGEEYYAGREARRRARLLDAIDTTDVVVTPPGKFNNEDPSIHRKKQQERPTGGSASDPTAVQYKNAFVDDEDGFPLEGQTEAQTECQHCHFKPKTKPTTFVMLNLMVPQKSSTTLNECFDAHFKIEYIDDYKCDKCRLQHAIESFQKHLSRARSDDEIASIQNGISKLEKAVHEDPESIPSGVELPDIKLAPKRKISRHVQITAFPRVLVLHLSRSMYDQRNSSTKNAAKVSFPERLPLGGILNRRNYKLLGMVSHKGTHNSGHYESFRRQHVYAPYSTPHLLRDAGPYGATGNLDPSTVSSPGILPDPSSTLERPRSSNPNANRDEILSTAPVSPAASNSSTSLSTPSTRPSSGSASVVAIPKTPAPKHERISRESVSSAIPWPEGHSPRPNSSSDFRSSSSFDLSRFKRKKKLNDRWWRISDDKIKECKTTDVLGMQREVYLLFYEIERDDRGIQ